MDYKNILKIRGLKYWVAVVVFLCVIFIFDQNTLPEVFQLRHEVSELDDSIASLNGHLVFDEAFADSLAAGNTSVYNKADDMNRTTAHRGQTTDGSYLTKTCFVKAGKCTKWIFASKGHQELAVVAEAGGLVTMKIRVTNSSGFDRRFDDTKQVKKGLPQRKTSFELPTDKKNSVEIEIINCGKKDCSFVVISN